MFSVTKSHYLGDDLELTRPLIPVSAGLRATQPDLRGLSIICYGSVGAFEHFPCPSAYVVIHEAQKVNTKQKPPRSHVHISLV